MPLSHLQCLCLILALLCCASGNAPLPVLGAEVVFSAVQFQEAVRVGVEHIVLGDHIDMTDSLRFSRFTVLDSAMIAIVPNIQGGYTKSIRVRRWPRAKLQRWLAHGFDCSWDWRRS